MSESYWAYWLILLGVVFTVIMMLIQGVTTSNTQDYYQLKEITESAMGDSIDYAYYRMYGEVKINKEKFVENFLRRFAETVSITTTYQVDFYDLYEAPPKVSVRVKSATNAFNVAGDDTSIDVVNKLDAILETNVYGSDDTICSYYTDDETSGGAGGTSTPGGSGGSGTGGSTTPGGTGGSEGSGTGGSTTPGGTGGNEGSGTGGSTTPGGTGGNEGSGTGGSTTPEETSTPLSSFCNGQITGVTDQWLSRTIRGTSLVTGGNAYVYKTLDGIRGAKSSEKLAEAVPGDIFRILGETGDYWAIQFQDGRNANVCGWVKANHMAINLNEYMPQGSYSIEYNILNRSGSQYKIHGGNINGITNQRLYSSKFDGFTPLNYHYAKAIKNGVLPKLASGYTLVINDAYRPSKISTDVYGLLSKSPYLGTFNIDSAGNRWDVSWFIARSSKHNRGCALDVTLKKNGRLIDSPSPMHELSTDSIKYKTQTICRDYSCTTDRSKWSTGYAASPDAQYLNQLMFGSGIAIDDIPSEWWHYNDTYCASSLVTSAKNFWAGSY